MFDQPQLQAATAPPSSFDRLAPIAQIDFAKLAAIVRRQAKFIAVVTAGALLLMLGFVLLATPQYTAVTEILTLTHLRSIASLTAPGQSFR